MQIHNFKYLRKYYSNPNIKMRASDFRKCNAGWCEERVRVLHSLWIITNGKMRIEYKEKEYVLNKNDMFVFSSNKKYKATALCKNTEFLYFNFEHYSEDSNTKLMRLFFDGPGGYNEFEKEIDIAVNTLRYYKKDDTSPFIHFFAQGMVTVLLSKFFEINSDQYNNEDIFHESSKTDDIIDYIHNHINERLTTDDLAKVANVSRRTLYNYFRKNKDMTPHGYVWTVKINYAVKLINSGKYSMKEVATMVGYEDYKTFASVFKKGIGVSPSKFNK